MTYHIRIRLYTGYFVMILLAIIVYVYLLLLEGTGLDLVTIILFFYDLIWIMVPVFVMVT